MKHTITFCIRPHDNLPKCYGCPIYNSTFSWCELQTARTTYSENPDFLATCPLKPDILTIVGKMGNELPEKAYTRTEVLKLLLQVAKEIEA